MWNTEIDSLYFLGSLFNESNSRIQFIAITKVDVGPNVFNISIRNLFVDIWVLRFVIHGDESIAILADP